MCWGSGIGSSQEQETHRGCVTQRVVSCVQDLAWGNHQAETKWAPIQCFTVVKEPNNSGEIGAFRSVWVETVLFREMCDFKTKNFKWLNPTKGLKARK